MFNERMEMLKPRSTGELLLVHVKSDNIIRISESIHFNSKVMVTNQTLSQFLHHSMVHTETQTHYSLEAAAMT